MSPTSVNLLFRECGILNISQPHRPTRPVTGIVLLSFTFAMHTLKTATKAKVRLLAKLVPTFVDRGCCVVSTTNPYARILGFLDTFPCLQRTR
jgi:hypothetical protein